MRDPDDLFELASDLSEVPLGLPLVAALTGFADAGSAVTQLSDYLLETLEHQQLRHDVVGGRVVDLDAEEDDALLEQLVVRVRFLHAVAGVLDEGRQDVAGGRQLIGVEQVCHRFSKM
jgi:hypothetical protein